MLQVQKEQEDSSGYLTDDNKNSRKSNANSAMTVAEEFSSSMNNERSCNYMTHFILANSTNNCTINNSNSNNYEKTNRSTNILEEAELIMKKLEHEKLENAKLRAFHNKHAYHDPSINNVVVSKSTLKYGLIASMALGLLASFIYLLVVGVLNQHKCIYTAENGASNLSTYLIVMGCAGCVRLLTFFSCPFDYSKSILSKMYEHLVWRLVVNRFKSAYHSAAAHFRTRIWEQGDSASVGRRIYFRLACIGSFVFAFVCCRCQCCRCLAASCCGHNSDDEDEEDDVVRQHRRSSFQQEEFIKRPIPEVSFTLWEEGNENEASSAAIAGAAAKSTLTLKNTNLTTGTYNDMFKSSSSLSVITETTATSSRAIILNELNCFKPPFVRALSSSLSQKKSKNKNSQLPEEKQQSQEPLPNAKIRTSRGAEIVSSSMTRTFSFPIRSKKNRQGQSRSTNELPNSISTSIISKPTSSSNKKVKFNRESRSIADMRSGHTSSSSSGSSATATYGNLYFSGKYNNKYGTHKHLRKHHNKTQRPIRLFDFNSIRYGIFYLLQRALDVFILCWFIYGNYSVFNAEISIDDVFNPNSDTMLRIQQQQKVNQSLHISTSLNKTINTTINQSISIEDHNSTNSTKNDFVANSLICYTTAFFHILAVYALIALIVFVAISYQVYLLVKVTPSHEKHHHHHRHRSHYDNSNDPRQIGRLTVRPY